MLYLAVMGPGLIAATAGNDAGGVATYATAGASFGYSLLWVLILISIPLAVVQEMAARMGAATGKGLADLIREEFGLHWTTVAMLTLLVANAGTTIAEFAGIAAAAELLGLSKFIAVPVVAVLVWLLVVRGSYSASERIFLIFSALLLAYVGSAFLGRPDWGDVAKGTFVPSFHFNSAYFLMFISLIGTTISPYMQFFAQGAVVDKGITMREYKYERADVIFGSFFLIFVAFFIVVSTAATLHPLGLTVSTASDAARALEPVAGDYAYVLFALGLFGASMLAASVLPISTAYAVTGAFGWERSISASFSDAPIFNGLYTGLIAIGAVVVLFPNLPLVTIMVFSQFVQGILLPIVLVFLLKLANSKAVMGKYTNGPVLNAIAWGATGLITLLIALLIASSFLGELLRIGQ
ncbi:MAG: Nramp family divalent metal transporter [Chloroflexi bacterium]|nr:Nramp family divalent metal transporter [Chloroflexota bacterium]